MYDKCMYGLLSEWQLECPAALASHRGRELPEALSVAVGYGVRDFGRQLAERLTPEVDLLHILSRPVLGPDIVEREHEAVRVSQYQRLPLGGQFLADERV